MWACYCPVGGTRVHVCPEHLYDWWLLYYMQTSQGEKIMFWCRVLYFIFYIMSGRQDIHPGKTQFKTLHIHLFMQNNIKAASTSIMICFFICYLMRLFFKRIISFKNGPITHLHITGLDKFCAITWIFWLVKLLNIDSQLDVNILHPFFHYL